MQFRKIIKVFSPNPHTGGGSTCEIAVPKSHSLGRTMKDGEKPLAGDIVLCYGHQGDKAPYWSEIKDHEEKYKYAIGQDDIIAGVTKRKGQQ